jgi:hypothetical protein
MWKKKTTNALTILDRMMLPRNEPRTERTREVSGDTARRMQLPGPAYCAGLFVMD